MSLDLPETADEVVQRAKVDVQRELTGSNPFLPQHWLGAIITGIANRIFDFFVQLDNAVDLSFPDTTSGEHLAQWSSIFGTPKTPATQATGNVVATGTATTVIASATNYQSSDGLVYTTTAVATITAQSLSVTSITRVGTLATVTTAVDHNIASNVVVTISGAVETQYNGAKTITVTGLNTFTFTVTGSPSTPATGTILAGFTAASVPVQSVDLGDDTNQDLDAVLTLSSPIAGVDNNASVDFAEIGGGVDEETDADNKIRLLDRIQNPVAHFNVSDIENQAKLIAGVTRVFVEEVTPAIGQVTIFFMRDNDVDPIPSASEVTTVKNKILEIKPANTADVDVIVSAPVAVPTAFTFTNITPDTSTMRTAVTDSLGQFFDEETTVGVNVDQDKYRAAISNTVDIQTGDEITSFVLSTPTGDVTIAAGEIGTLGTVTFP